MEEATYLKIMRASAFYDLVVTTPLAIPVSFVFLWNNMRQFHIQLGLDGTIPQPDIYLIFLANLLGSLVVIWSLARLRLNLVILGRFDAVGRFVFSLWMIVALMNGASLILAGYLAIEVFFGVVQALPIKKSTTA